MKLVGHSLSKNVNWQIYEGFLFFKFMAERIKWSSLNAETLSYVALLYGKLENLKNDGDFWSESHLYDDNAAWVDAIVEGFFWEIGE